jgi:hypothetical protein
LQFDISPLPHFGIFNEVKSGNPGHKQATNARGMKPVKKNFGKCFFGSAAAAAGIN